jgi:hypothetical protein
MCSGCLVSQTAARETAALRELLAIYSAEEKLHSSKNKYGTLEDLAGEKLIDETLAKGTKAGYKFELELSTDGFDVYAIPQNYSKWSINSGKRSFYINQKGVATYAEKQGRRADASDEQVSQ